MCAACSGVEMVGLLMLFLSECSGNATNDAADAEADSTTPKSDGDPWQTDKMYIIYNYIDI
jgi:4-hydroxybenzoate polyprenyltransferase